MIFSQNYNILLARELKATLKILKATIQFFITQTALIIAFIGIVVAIQAK